MGEMWLVLMGAVREIFNNGTRWVGPMEKALVTWTEISVVPEVSRQSLWSCGSVRLTNAAAKMRRRISLRVSPFHFLSWQIAPWGLQRGSWVLLPHQCLFLSYGWVLCGLRFSGTWNWPWVWGFPTHPLLSQQKTHAHSLSLQLPHKTLHRGVERWDPDLRVRTTAPVTRGQPGPGSHAPKPWPLSDHCVHCMTFDTTAPGWYVWSTDCAAAPGGRFVCALTLQQLSVCTPFPDRGTAVSPFSGWKNWGSERLSTSAKVTKLVNCELEPKLHLSLEPEDSISRRDCKT